MKHNTQIVIGMIVLVGLFLGGILGTMGIFMNREESFRTVIAELRAELQAKDEEIAALKTELESVKAQLDAAPAPDTGADDDDGTFRYLALGNSLTWHVKCDYWWNECGMAASKAENDFVHVVAKGLEEQYDEVEFKAYNFSVWEITAHDRIQTVQVIDAMLTEDLDLITLQLSENVTDMTTFAKDFEELVKHVKTKCPNAKLVIVDDFWNLTKGNIKKGIAEKLGVAFADLSAIRGKTEYQSAMWATVYDEKGNAHVVDHVGVACHPGDKGMKYIGEAILAVLSA